MLSHEAALCTVLTLSLHLCRAQMERDDPEALKRVAQAAIARAAAAMLPKKAAERRASGAPGVGGARHASAGPLTSTVRELLSLAA